MAIRVKAIATGFRDGFRLRAGTEFVLAEGEKPPSWVEVLGGEEAPKKSRAKKAEAEPEVDAEQDAII